MELIVTSAPDPLGGAREFEAERTLWVMPKLTDNRCVVELNDR